MRSVLPAAVLAVALVTAASTVNAQAVAVAGPRAGSWGAEASAGYGGFSGATLLRFSSPSAAWLLGVAFSAMRERDDLSPLPPTTESTYSGNVDARIGRRWWRGDPSARLRPLTGIGIAGGLGSYQSQQRWNAGGYGEVGATYFFSPHVSLGASSEISLDYGQERYRGVAGDLVNRHWWLRGNLARLNAGVYF